MKPLQIMRRDGISPKATVSRWGLLRLVALLSFLLSGLPAQAATAYNFSPLLGNLPPSCRYILLSFNSYTCGVVTLAAGDSISVGLLGLFTPATVTFTGAFTTADGNLINASGATSDLNLITKGVLTLGANTVVNADVTGTAAINMGDGSTIRGNLTASTTTGVVTLAVNSTVGGFIHTDAGAVDVGGASTVGGDIKTKDGVVTLLTNIKVGGDIRTVAGGITIGDGSSTCGSVISTGAGIVTLTNNIKIGGSIKTVVGAITLGSGSTVVGDIIITGNGVVTLTGVNVGGKVATVAGAITLTSSRVGGSVAASGAGVVTLTSSTVNDATLVVSSPCAVTPPSGSVAGVFECLETGTNSPWDSTARKPLYTKLASTSFTLDIAALKTDGTLEANYVASGGAAKAVTVELVDGSGTTVCASRSAISPAVSQALSFVAADAGRKTTASMTVNKAYSNLRCRVTDANQSPSVVACSTDNFAVRPQQFTVTAPTMNNAELTLTPKDVAGNPFMLNADAGVVGGYSGTAPELVVTKVYDHNATAIATGTLSGTFSVGNGVSAQGTSFKYLDVGNIQLLADAVVDSSFTSVDQSTDCVTRSTSNTLVGGKYGCNIGSAESGKFGRWYPNHYSFAGAVTASCLAGGFTYMGNDALGVTLTLKAHAFNGAVASAADPVASRYTMGYTNLASVTISSDNNGEVLAVTRLASPDFPVMPDTSLWAVGQWAINDTYVFNKRAAADGPDGPYDMFKLKAAVNDPDGSALIGTVIEQETAATQVRYGRIRMQNAYGSERLDLPMTMRSEYWAATGGWQLNSADTCTVAKLVFTPVGADITGNTCVVDTGTAPGNSGKGCNTPILLASRQFKEAGVAGFAGDFNLWLRATHVGSLDVSATVPAWLQYNWAGTVGNPKGRATFGLFKSPIIYRRENY